MAAVKKVAVKKTAKRASTKKAAAKKVAGKKSASKVAVAKKSPEEQLRTSFNSMVTLAEMITDDHIEMLLGSCGDAGRHGDRPQS